MKRGDTMCSCIETAYGFPAMPLESWKASKETLHLFLQVVGKIRMATHPKLNHWWHVSFYLSPVGLTTGAIPYCGREFEIEFDFIRHELNLRSSTGEQRHFSLQSLSVAEF